VSVTLYAFGPSSRKIICLASPTQILILSVANRISLEETSLSTTCLHQFVSASGHPRQSPRVPHTPDLTADIDSLSLIVGLWRSELTPIASPDYDGDLIRVRFVQIEKSWLPSGLFFGRIWNVPDSVVRVGSPIAGCRRSLHRIYLTHHDIVGYNSNRILRLIMVGFLRLTPAASWSYIEFDESFSGGMHGIL
jgi:hypothetical protein